MGDSSIPFKIEKTFGDPKALIDTFFKQHQYLFVKQIRGTKILVPARQAVDNIWIKSTSIEVDADGNERIPMHKRSRPYLPYKYDSYFCDGWKNDTIDIFDHEDCDQCRPLESDYWQGCDMGFLTGSINNVVVFDIDHDKFIWEGRKGEKSADEIIDIIKSLGFDLPETWKVRTPSGGYHLYYEFTGRFETSQSAVFGGIDILGERTKATFPTDFNEYEWVVSPYTPLAELPFWVKDLYKPKPRKPFVPKPKKKPDADVRSDVEKVLNRWPISAVGNKLWCSIGYLLHDLDCFDLFEQWSRTDSRGRIANRAQFRGLDKPSNAEDSVRAFFGKAKNNGVNISS